MDCMKMWPWMRDLPTSVWAGRGWAFDENGLRRLSSTGGSGAMQGVEVFESVGAAAEELKSKDAIVREVGECSLACGASCSLCGGTEAEQVPEEQLGETEWCAKRRVASNMPSLVC